MTPSSLQALPTTTLAIFGRANVGKSTLFNALMQKRLSIVSHRANTTRQQLQAEVNFQERFKLLCTDTPGIQAKKGMAYDSLRCMQRAVALSVEAADCLLLVSEAIQWIQEDEKIFRLLAEHRKNNLNKKLFWVINKIDRVPEKEKFLKYIQSMDASGHHFDGIFLISAKKSEGLQELIKALSKSAADVKPALVEASSCVHEQDQKKRMQFHIQEAVREQLYTLFYAEIPYLVKISVDNDATAGNDPLAAWHVTLSVDRISQKKILIGRKGSQLRKIRENSLRRLKELFGKNFDLQWFVNLKGDVERSDSHLPILQRLDAPPTAQSNDS